MPTNQSDIIVFGYIWDVNNSALKDIYAGHGDSFHVHSFSPFATSECVFGLTFFLSRLSVPCFGPVFTY